MISVTNGFNRDKYAALENQASHKLARPEVVNVLGHDNFLGETAETRKTPGRKAGRRATSIGQVDSTHDVAEVTDRGWFAAGKAYLLLVHVLDDDFAAATERVCGRSVGHGEEKTDAGQAESIGSCCLRCTHVLSPGVIVRMSLQNSKYAGSGPR